MIWNRENLKIDMEAQRLTFLVLPLDCLSSKKIKNEEREGINGQLEYKKRLKLVLKEAHNMSKVKLNNKPQKSEKISSIFTQILIVS